MELPPLSFEGSLNANNPETNAPHADAFDKAKGFFKSVMKPNQDLGHFVKDVLTGDTHKAAQDGKAYLTDMKNIGKGIIKPYLELGHAAKDVAHGVAAKVKGDDFMAEQDFHNAGHEGWEGVKGVALSAATDGAFNYVKGLSTAAKADKAGPAAGKVADEA